MGLLFCTFTVKFLLMVKTFKISRVRKKWHCFVYKHMFVSRANRIQLLDLPNFNKSSHVSSLGVTQKYT
jgi:hypothetical protein